MKTKYLNKLTLSIILSSVIFNPAYSQSLSNKNVKKVDDSSIIYKCQDSFGKISYVNMSEQKGKCVKTDLSNPSKMMVVENHDRKTTAYSRSQLNSSNRNTETRKIANQLSQEQYLRDQKRLSILNEELKNEKEQQKTVNSMLKNVGDDNEQQNRLETMKLTHQKNIAALTKEINNIKNKKAKSSTTPSIPKPINVDIEKHFIENGQSPINMLNTNPDIVEVKEGQLPLDLPVS